MSAIDTGAREMRKINPGLFEMLTREEFRKLGYMKAKQFYKTEEKREEFVLGWIAVMQPYFKMMADGPKRRVIQANITIECDKCHAEEEIEFSGHDVTEFVRKYKSKPCPACQKSDRHVEDEFDTDVFEKE